MTKQIDMIVEDDTSKKTILVVDDEESIRKTLKYMLKKVGYHVKTADHASVAFELLGEFDIDLVISDIVMPDINGLELVSQINKQYNPPQILLITGEPSLETATSAVKLGVFDYISKPVNKRALLDVVHQALEKKSLLDEKERLVQQNLRYSRDLEEKLDQRTYNLLLTEEKYRSLFENTNVGVGISTESGVSVEVNSVMCKISGYSPEEYKTLNLADTYVDSASRVRLLAQMDLNAGVDQYEAEFYRKNGTSYWASLTVKKILYRQRPAFLTTVLDISKRKENELKLQQALADKEEMLREIHHRTKNNMNVIISLLNMQSYSSDESNIKEILSKVNDRIYSMSLVHEQVYLSRQFSSMALKQYIKSMIMRHYAGPDLRGRSINFISELADVEIGLSQAIPLGLALNEVLANVMKHPYEPDSEGEVLVNMDLLEDNSVTISIRDHGKGFPEDLKLDDPATLGLHMVKILVEDQLMGTLTLTSEEGACVNLNFPLEKIA